jgi:hypothetical protein
MSLPRGIKSNLGGNSLVELYCKVLRKLPRRKPLGASLDVPQLLILVLNDQQVKSEGVVRGNPLDL